MTKTKTQILMATAAALGMFGIADMAQAKQTHKGQIANPAQLQREHNRAIKAGDAANDPFDSSSSDSLNQQQLAKAQGATPMADGSNVASNSMTNSTPDINSAAATTDNSSVPANSMASTTNTTATGDTANPTDDSTVPPANPAASPDQATPAPMATPSEDKGKTGSSANPTDATDAPPAQQ